MTQEVSSPLEDRLRAALTEVAEQVSIDQLPEMWFDEGARRAPSRKVRLFAVAALADPGVDVDVDVDERINAPRARVPAQSA